MQVYNSQSYFIVSIIGFPVNDKLVPYSFEEHSDSSRLLDLTRFKRS